MRRWGGKELCRLKIIEADVLNRLFKYKANGFNLITLEIDTIRGHRGRRKFTFREVMLIHIYNHHFRTLDVKKEILQVINMLSISELNFIFQELIDHTEENIYFVTYSENGKLTHSWGNNKEILSMKNKISNMFYLVINLTKINKEVMRVLYGH